MKTSGVILLLVVLAGALDAQAPTVEYKRSFFAVGAAFTIGDSVQTDNLGYGFSANGFQYFDPSRSFGFYYGFSASFLVHNVGGAEEVRNKTYHDLVLSVSFRSFTEVKKLDWQ